MSDLRWARFTEVMHGALQLAPDQRGAYLEDACGEDHDLRREVESVLAADARIAPSLLQSMPNAEPGSGTGTGSASAPAVGEVFAARYVLVRKLGEGGMGQVWLAEQAEPMRRTVALKLVRPGLYDEAVVRRFKAERQSLAIMDHPAIARVFDAGTTPLGQPFFVMEYVPGRPITEYCDDRGLGLRARLELFIRVCEGVQHAHQKAIIHRDLKPANVLVIEVDGKPVPKIIDFGLAKALTPAAGSQDEQTRLGLFMGTPGYMSPEQLDRNSPDIDTRTDVYSLGVILYELLTGLRPFDGIHGQTQSFEQMLRQLREDEPPRPSMKLSLTRPQSGPAVMSRGGGHRQWSPLLRGDLDWITLKALAHERERRYATPTELGADLLRHLNHEPVLARPASSAYRIGRYLRRNRVLASALAGVLLALMAGLAIALWQAQVARVAAQDALDQESMARRIAALAAEQAANAAAQDGQIATSIARQAYAVRLDPDNPELRVELFQLLEAQDYWWLPRGGKLRHPGLRVVYLSPDGRRLLTGAEDGSVRLWDTATMRPVGATLHHGGRITACAFSPDSGRVATGSADHTARIWDTFTGQPLGAPLQHLGEVTDVRFSADGRLVATGSQDHTARLWDAFSGRALGAVMRHDDAVNTVTFDPQGRRLLTASDDHTARLWNAVTGLPGGPTLRAESAILDAEFSGDGRRIVTASTDMVARLWDAASGRPLGPRMKHEFHFGWAKFSPDGNQLLTDTERIVGLWDARTSEPVGSPVTIPSQTFAAAFSADSRHLLAVAQDGTLRLIDAATSAQLGAAVQLSENEVVSADIQPRNEQIVTGGADGDAQFWTMARSPGSHQELRREAVDYASFSHDGTRIVTGGPGQTATIRDVESGNLLAPPLALTGAYQGAHWSDDDRRLLIQSGDGAESLWNALSGAPLSRPLRFDPTTITNASPDLRILLEVAADGSVRRWDLPTGTVLGPPLLEADTATRWRILALFSPNGQEIVTGAFDSRARSNVLRTVDARTGLALGPPIATAGHVRFAAFSSDGSKFALILDESSVHLWDVRRGMALGAPIPRDQRTALDDAFSPDGTRFLSTTAAGLRIWDATAGAPVGRPMSHPGVLTKFSFSPDGTRILTASTDQTARLWDGHSGEPIGAPMRHEGAIYDAEFSADGRQLITASFDRTARIWDAWTGLPLSGPLRAGTPLRSAWFAPDGRHALTVALGWKDCHLWPVFTVSRDEALLLADLAEDVGGFRIDAASALVPVVDRREKLDGLQARLASDPEVHGDVSRFATEILRTGITSPDDRMRVPHTPAAP